MFARRRTVVAGVTIAIVLVAAAAMTSLTASASPGSANDLAGTWSVTVNRPAPLPPLNSLQVFTGDGSVIEMANEAQALRTTAYGSWERVDGRMYAATMVFFRFDPATGAHAATQKIDRSIRLSQDGQTFTHIGRASVYDPAGNLVTSFPVAASGRRMPVDRIPEQP